MSECLLLLLLLSSLGMMMSSLVASMQAAHMQWGNAADAHS